MRIIKPLPDYMVQQPRLTAMKTINPTWFKHYCKSELVRLLFLCGLLDLFIPAENNKDC